MLALGIDVGGTSVKTAAVGGGQVLWTAQSDRYALPDTDQLIAAIAQASAKARGSTDRVGLCVPGLMDPDGDRISYTPNVPGIVGISLRALIQRGTESNAVPTIVNDANATGYDIYCTRKPVGRLLVLAIGAGIGGSVLDDGKPLYVDGASPGHLGQVDVSLDADAPIGPDGGRGGLEAYLGAAALHARYGDNAASKIQVTDPAFRALARIIRICHAIYRPHHVALAGGTGIRLGRLAPALQDEVNVHLTSVAQPQWTLFTGDSDFHAAAGAARIAAADAWPKN